MTKNILMFICASSLFFTGVFAEEGKRVEIGERPPVTKEANLPRCADMEEESEEGEELIERSMKGAKFISTYQGAYHKPFRVSLFGDEAELEDGSIWVIKKSDRTKTYDWLTSDDIAVTINHSWFSNYQFCLTNLATGKRVEAELHLGPIYNGINTRWIIGINYITGQVCLNDSSVWDVSGFDHYILNGWVLNDTIIVGHDDTLLGRTNILINVSAPKNISGLTYVSADCVY